MIIDEQHPHAREVTGIETGNLVAVRPLTSEELTSLIQAAAEVAGQPDLEAVLTTTVHTAKEATGARYAALGVIGEHGTLSDFLHEGMHADDVAAVGDLPTGKGVLGALITDPHTIRLDSIIEHPGSVGFPEHHPEMTTFLGVPIKVGDRVFGNLYLADKLGGFTEEDQAKVEGLAAIAGAAVSTARLRDRLTRLALVEDRERIARDLHDAVIQDLFAVGLGLQNVALTSEDTGMAASLDDAVDRLDQAIGSLRTFVFDLRAASQAHTDPARAVRQLVTRLSAPYGVDTSVEVGRDLGRLPADRLDDALHIVRESVSNALRHSGTDRIDVRLDRGDLGLIVAVRDHGSGFDAARRSGGMGLGNMRARTERVGGQLEIDSAPGAGTVVRAVLPL